MKTNVTLQSSDRELFGTTIRQETKTQFLSVSDLQKAYETARWQYGWSDRKIADIMQTTSFKESVYYLLYNQQFIKTDFMGFIEMCEKEGISKVLKGLGVYKTTGARQTKTTFCNMYVWLLLAIELNPILKANVIIWFGDTLIFDRIEAGTEYMPMNAKIKEIVVNPDYSKYARLINIKVFGKHITGMRNLSSSKELRKITDIEKFIIQSIEMGFLKSESDVTKAIENYK